MGEPLSWLKLVPRGQTPTSSSSAVHPPPESKATRDFRAGDASRRPGSSRRISSCISPDTEPDPIAAVEEGGVADLVVRDQDQVWYNPSLEQMVEALQVQIMTHGVLEPIPVHYNAYVLHLVEGFAQAQENIVKRETACQEAKESLEHHLEQFRLVADEWSVRESQYKAEVKRLEVLLSKCSRNGLEAVTLARTHSVVDRSGSEGSEGSVFLSRLKKLRDPNRNGSSTSSNTFIPRQGEGAGIQENNRPPTPKILDYTNDYRMSERARLIEAASRAFTSQERWGQRRDNNPQAEFDCREWARRRMGPTPDSAICGYYLGDDDENITAKAGTTTAPRHERCHSAFSFEAGDDYDVMCHRPEEDMDAYSAHEGVNSAPVNKYQHSDDGSNESTARYTPSEEVERSTDPDSPAAQSSFSADYTGNYTPHTKAARGSRDTITPSKQATIGASPSRSLHSSRSASGAELEVAQRQVGETDARIAATLAMASKFGGANQRKSPR
ncbi:hypothetical protein F5Y03DRAFT_379581 [Xylaria venustula]|nr:hypothetical protein F5Y03DRAFT_379581 [Xylaria venustula]